MGLAKSGTRTICHALNELGVRAYHSEADRPLGDWEVLGFSHQNLGIDPKILGVEFFLRLKGS